MKNYTFYGCDHENDCGWGCGYRSIQNVFIYYGKQHPDFSEICKTCEIKYSGKLEFASHEIIKKVVCENEGFKWKEHFVRNFNEFEKIGFLPGSISILIHDGAIYCMVHENNGLQIIDPHVYTKCSTIPSFSYENGGIGEIDPKFFLTRNMHLYGKTENDDFIEEAYLLNIECLE